MSESEADSTHYLHFAFAKVLQRIALGIVAGEFGNKRLTSEYMGELVRHRLEDAEDSQRAYLEDEAKEAKGEA